MNAAYDKAIRITNDGGTDVQTVIVNNWEFDCVTEVEE